MSTRPELMQFMAAAGRRCGVSLLLAGVAIIVFASTAATDQLQFDRAAIQAGELWRLVTGHWTHWSLDHLGWDMFAFGLLAAGCERMGRMRFVACVFASTVAISLAVMALRPDMYLYRGLSGVDSALFVLLAMELIRRSVIDGDRSQATMLGVCMLAFMLKVGFELRTGSTMFVDSAQSRMVPLVLAHVVGGGVGLGFALAWPRMARRSGHLPRPRSAADAAGLGWRA